MRRPREYAHVRNDAEAGSKEPASFFMLPSIGRNRPGESLRSVLAMVFRSGEMPGQDQVEFGIVGTFFIEDAVLRIGRIERHASGGKIANQAVLVRIVDVLFVVDDREEDGEALKGTKILSSAFLLRFQIDQAHFQSVAGQGCHAFDAGDGPLDGIQFRRFGFGVVLGIPVASGDIPWRTADRAMGASGKKKGGEDWEGGAERGFGRSGQIVHVEEPGANRWIYRIAPMAATQPEPTAVATCRTALETTSPAA